MKPKTYPKRRGIPTRITSAWLLSQSACIDQRAKFAQVFWRGMKLTRENLLIAGRRGLNLWWLVARFTRPSRAHVQVNRALNQIRKDIDVVRDALTNARDVEYETIRKLAALNTWNTTTISQRQEIARAVYSAGQAALDTLERKLVAHAIADALGLDR